MRGALCRGVVPSGVFSGPVGPSHGNNSNSWRSGHACNGVSILRMHAWNREAALPAQWQVRWSASAKCILGALAVQALPSPGWVVSALAQGDRLHCIFALLKTHTSYAHKHTSWRSSCC